MLLLPDIYSSPLRIMLGFDHPESLQFEMQLTWVEDTWTVAWLPTNGGEGGSLEMLPSSLTVEKVWEGRCPKVNVQVPC